MTKTIISDKIILYLAMLTGGCLSVWFGKDLCWDVAYYHYYNPDALFQGRHNMDFWPVSFLHQFINPTIDFLSYFLINYFTPISTQFILGAIHGINFWLLFVIADTFFREKNTVHPLYAFTLCILTASLGMYGPTTLPGIGSLQNDNLISIFVLGFVLLQIKKRSPFFSGILLGIGVGLKLTAGIFVISALLTAIILPISLLDRAKLFLILLISTTCGILLSAGYWMYMMWQQHHSPLFPFFNNIFHSPDFLWINWCDKRFMPSGIMQTLFYPFYFSWDGHTGDRPFQDFRFLVVYVLFIITAMLWLYRKWQHKQSKFDYPLFWLLAFFIFSYIAWQYYFSIARYLATLEMLAPLVICLLIVNSSKNILLDFILIISIFYILFSSMVPVPMVRATWYRATYFNVKLPNSIYYTPKATVLMAYPAYVADTNPRPQSYLIHFFPRTWRFIGIPFLHEKYFHDEKAAKKIRQLINEGHDKIYLLASDINMPELHRVARIFNLIPSSKCEKIYSDRQKITHQDVLLCPTIMASHKMTPTSPSTVKKTNKKRQPIMK
jgi:hypothetical protein